MPKPNRPTVGPADPETRRKKLREVLDEPTRATGVNRDKKPTMRDAVDAGVEMGSDKPKKKHLKRRYGTEGKTEDELGA